MINKIEVINRVKAVLRENPSFFNQFTKRTYYCKNYISIAEKSEQNLKDKELDIAVVLEDTGLTISVTRSESIKKILKQFSPNSINAIIFNNKKILNITKNSDGSFTIEYPKFNDLKTWKQLTIGLSNLCLTLSIFGSSNYVFFIVQDGVKKKRKLFSTNNFLFSKIVTAFNIIYNVFLYNPFQKYLTKKLVGNNLSPTNERLVVSKLINYINSLNDVYSVNIGDTTFYLNIKDLKSHPAYKDFLKQAKEEGADPNRLRSVTDWILKACKDNKDIIVYSDLNSYIAIAHEIGHYELSKEKILGSIQRNSGFNQTRVTDVVNFFLGSYAGVTKNLNLIAIGTIVNFVLNTPQLAVEFLASYRGIKLLERLKVEKKIIETAREWLGYAYLTYINGALSRSGGIITTSAGAASAGRILMRKGIFK